MHLLWAFTQRERIPATHKTILANWTNVKKTNKQTWCLNIALNLCSLIWNNFHWFALVCRLTWGAFGHSWIRANMQNKQKKAKMRRFLNCDCSDKSQFYTSRFLPLIKWWLINVRNINKLSTFSSDCRSVLVLTMDNCRAALPGVKKYFNLYKVRTLQTLANYTELLNTPSI